MASPIGFSPIAALVIVLLALSNGVSDARDVWIDAAVVVATTLALTCGLIEQLGIGALDDRVRLFALIGAALITMTLVVRIQPFGAAGRRTRLRQRMALADTGSLDGFLADLTKEPMLKDLSVLSEHDLIDYPSRRDGEDAGPPPPVEHRRSAGGDRPSTTTRGNTSRCWTFWRDRDATHIGLLSQSPLRIGLVRLPDLLRNTDAEIDLGLAFRMARLTMAGRPLTAGAVDLREGDLDGFFRVPFRNLSPRQPLCDADARGSGAVSGSGQKPSDARRRGSSDLLHRLCATGVQSGV